jgi:hypothetical protein
VIGSCPQCGRSIKPAPGVGRPKTFCSVACRRAAEFEIRRCNERLAYLERLASDLRLTTERTGWEIPGEMLQAEIERQAKRLRDLCAGDEEESDE